MKVLGERERQAMGRLGRAYYDREFDRDTCLERLERRLAALVAAGGDA
jgi:hypothetical protein